MINTQDRGRRVMLTPSVARRIGKVVRREELATRNPSPNLPVGARAWNPGVLRAKCTAVIPSGSIDAPSTSGTCTIYRWDPVAETTGPDPALVEVRCCNDQELPADIPVDATLKVAWIDGDYWLVQADCPPSGGG